MSEQGDIIFAWWKANIADRNSGRARALAARLRRSHGVEALAELDVHQLAGRLGLKANGAGRLVRLVQALAEVRENDGRRLAQRLGGQEPALSPLRFQRLLRARGDELTTALRRAVPMADRRCNVAALGPDLLNWDHTERGDRIRTDWCFDYFGASPRELDATTEQVLSETDQ